MWLTTLLILLLLTHHTVTNPKFEIRHGFGYETLGNINFIKSRIITYRMIDNSIIFDGITRLIETGELLNKVCGKVAGNYGTSEFYFASSDEMSFHDARAECVKTKDYPQLPEIFHREQLSSLTNLLTSNQFAWLNLEQIGKDSDGECMYRWGTSEAQVDMTIFDARQTYPARLNPARCYAKDKFERYAVDRRKVLWSFPNDRNTNTGSNVVICQKVQTHRADKYNTLNQCQTLKTHWTNQSRLLTDRMEIIYGLLPSTLLSQLHKRITNETLIPHSNLQKHTVKVKEDGFTKYMSNHKKRRKRALASLVFSVFRGALSAYSRSRIIARTKDNGQRISALQIDVQDLRFKQVGLLSQIEEMRHDFQYFKVTSLQFDLMHKQAQSVYNSVTLSLEVLRDIIVKTVQKQASALVISPTIIQKIQNRDTSRDRVRLALEYDRMSSEVDEVTLEGIVIKTIIPGYEYMPHKIIQIYSFPSIKEQAQIKLEYSVLAVTHDKTSYIPLNYLFVRECEVRGCEKPFNNIRSQFELCGAAQYFDLDQKREKCEWAPYQHDSYLIKTSTGFAYSLREKTVITVQCPGLSKVRDMRLQLGYAGHLTLREGCQTTIFLNSEAIPLHGPIENVEYVINGTAENLNVDEIENDIHINTIAKIEKVHVHNTQSINMTFYIAIASVIILVIKIALLAIFVKKGFRPFKFIMAHKDALKQLFIDVKHEQQLASAPLAPPTGGNSPTSEGSPSHLGRQESSSYGHQGHKKNDSSQNIIIPLQVRHT